MLKLDVGCGQNKKNGFLGIDIASSQGVDFVLDITNEKLPLQDNSVDELFTITSLSILIHPKRPLKN